MSARYYLNLHGIGAPHDSVEADERPYWLTAERLDDVLARASKHADVGITFDDGNISDLALALPLLKKHGISAVFFIPTDRIGAPHYLSADDIRALHREGMGIGSHGLAHRRWSSLNDEELDAEINKPLTVLAEIIGEPVRSVGVPFGAYDDRVLTSLRKAGVTQVFTSDGGPCLPGAWLLPRNSLRSDMPLTQIEAMLEQPRDAATFYFRAAKRVGRRVLRRLAG